MLKNYTQFNIYLCSFEENLIFKKIKTTDEEKIWLESIMVRSRNFDFHARL